MRYVDCLFYRPIVHHNREMPFSPAQNPTFFLLWEASFLLCIYKKAERNISTFPLSGSKVLHNNLVGTHLFLLTWKNSELQMNTKKASGVPKMSKVSF